MAITPQSYPFSGGAFMGGGGTEVRRDDIHSLILTKDGETIGNYNPLTGDTTIDIPNDTFHSDGGFSNKTSVANVPLELFSVNVPRDGVYIVSLLCHIRPTALAGSKSRVIFSINGPDGVGLPNTWRNNIIDDSDDFDQPVDFTVILRLKAGANSFRALFSGAYTVFGDRWSVTSL
jgi:hypothetical protein